MEKGDKDHFTNLDYLTFIINYIKFKKAARRLEDMPFVGKHQTHRPPGSGARNSLGNVIVQPVSVLQAARLACNIINKIKKFRAHRLSHVS